ncbi:MAG: VOC family protein [Thermoplasmata archaeon]
MKVKGISWIGLKASSRERYKSITEILSRILEGWEFKTGDGYTHFTNGTAMIEVYVEGEGKDEFVCGLEVEDIDQSILELRRLGLEILGQKECADGSCWQHFKMPDGTEWEVKKSAML